MSKEETALTYTPINAEQAVGDDDYLLQASKNVFAWEESDKEMAQGRTNFQIEKFIVHDNFTIPSAFKSAVINRRSVAENLLNGIQEAKRTAREFHFKWDGKDKTQPIWWKNRQGGEDLCWYDIDEFNFNRFMEGLDSGFKAQVTELEFFDKLIARLIELNGGHPPTKEEFDAEHDAGINNPESRHRDKILDQICDTHPGSPMCKVFDD